MVFFSQSLISPTLREWSVTMFSFRHNLSISRYRSKLLPSAMFRVINAQPSQLSSQQLQSLPGSFWGAVWVSGNWFNCWTTNPFPKSSFGFSRLQSRCLLNWQHQQLTHFLINHSINTKERIVMTGFGFFCHTTQPCSTLENKYGVWSVGSVSSTRLRNATTRKTNKFDLE